jgi:hypothetical protein
VILYSKIQYVRFWVGSTYFGTFRKNVLICVCCCCSCSNLCSIRGLVFVDSLSLCAMPVSVRPESREQRPELGGYGVWTVELLVLN